MKIQYSIRDGLQKSINEYNAVGGAGVVMNISNGEIISLVSLPYFDPNKKLDQNGKLGFNMITSSALEPRTSAKIFKASMALKTGKITSFTQFDARFPLKVGRFTITISYGHGIAVSPLYLITAFSGIMNDGIMNNPTLLISSNPPMGKRIVLPKTSNLMKELIRLNVIEGTNKFVEVRGYLEQLKNKKEDII